MRPICLLLPLLLAPNLFAQTDWTGKRVLVKQPGIKIGYSDDSGKQVYVGELTAMAYTVLKESDGFLKVRHRDQAGWFPKTSALLPEEAVVYFAERSRSAKPNDGAPHAYLGWAHRERQQYDLALDAYNEAIKRDPRPDWYNNRGLIHMDMKAYDKAIADFSEAIKRNPKFLTAIDNRSAAFEKAKNLPAALGDLNELLRLDPAYGPGLFRRAKIHLDQKNVDLAVADLSRILKDDPTNTAVLIERGQLFADQKKLDAAIADLSEALRHQKDNVEVLLTRSQLYADKKMYAAALVDADAAVAAVPTSVDAIVARGWNRLLLGRFDQARDDFAKAYEMNPKHAGALNTQAWMLATTPDAKYRDGKKAVTLAKSAVDLTQGNEPTILDTYAAALAESGDFVQAVQIQERAIQAMPAASDQLPDMRARLEKYKKKEPHRQSVSKS